MTELERATSPEALVALDVVSEAEALLTAAILCAYIFPLGYHFFWQL